MATEYPMPWTVRSAEAAGLGLSRAVLRADGFEHIRRAVWAAPGVAPLDPDVRIAAVAATMPGHAVIGGWSAARLHERLAARDGIEVFDGGADWEDLRAPGSVRPGIARVVLCVPRHSRLELRPDVRIYRTPVGEMHRAIVTGVPATTGDRTAFDLGRRLPTTRAVMALDRLLHLGTTSIPGIEGVISMSPRWRGIIALRKALALADGGAESPQESVLRLLWVAIGLPTPRANKVIRDLEGRFVARVDLIDTDAGVVGEYDGAAHADARRRSDDARRQESLEALGLIVVRATAVDVREDAAPAWQGRLRAAYMRAARRRAADRRWIVVDV